jgi:hypothetical protein
MGFNTPQIVAMAFSAISTGVGAIGAMQQQRGAQDTSAYQAAVARNNAIIARQNADAVRARGEVAEDDHARKIIQVKGAARARQAALGFLVDDTEDSTNVQLVADLAEAGTLDILRIRDNTEIEARKAEAQGINFDAQAGLFDVQGASANPLLAGAGALFSGAAKIGQFGLSTQGSVTNVTNVFNAPSASVGSSSSPPPGIR